MAALTAPLGCFSTGAGVGSGVGVAARATLSFLPLSFSGLEVAAVGIDAAAPVVPFSAGIILGALSPSPPPLPLPNLSAFATSAFAGAGAAGPPSASSPSCGRRRRTSDFAAKFGVGEVTAAAELPPFEAAQALVATAALLVLCCAAPPPLDRPSLRPPPVRVAEALARATSSSTFSRKWRVASTTVPATSKTTASRTRE
mmetsp:Transcript_12587/g.41252  ORF Transcript_12587/g.41252 Transcript_12587/m.41252 type:complete len:200 (+) Transcript_12587:683-1282(+)